MSSFDFLPQITAQSLPNQEAIAAVCALGQEVFDVARFEIKCFRGGQFYDLSGLGLEDFVELRYHDFYDRAHRPSFGLIVNDLSANARTANEPMVASGPRLRFYADMPIFDRGVLRGIICLYDQLPGVVPSQRIERQLQRFAQLCAPLLRPETVAQAVTEPERVFGVFRLNLLTREMWSSPALLTLLQLEPDTALTIDAFLRYFNKIDAETLIVSFWQSVSQGTDFDLNLPIQSDSYDSKAVIIRGGIDKTSDTAQLWLCAVVSPAYEDDMDEGSDWQDKVAQAVVAPLKTIGEFAVNQGRSHDGFERLHGDLARARQRLDDLEGQMSKASQTQRPTLKIDGSRFDNAYHKTTLDDLNLWRREDHR